MPKVSFIIPAYNSENTIQKCLDSIFEQKYKDFEIIVVNDGSTDKTPEILEIYQNKIKIIHQENKGASNARNRGFEESVGEYVFFCDADILFKKQAIKDMVSVLDNHPHASYVYSSFRFGYKKFACEFFNPEKLRKNNYISTNSPIKREDFPGFDEGLEKFQDWDLWLTMLKNNHIGVWIPRVLFRVKTGNSGMSQWLPSFVYKIPWIKISEVEKYNQAKKIIYDKHGLT